MLQVINAIFKLCISFGLVVDNQCECMHAIKGLCIYLLLKHMHIFNLSTDIWIYVWDGEIFSLSLSIYIEVKVANL